MFALAERSLGILSEFKGTEESQQIIGSPVAKRQPAIKGKNHDHWFLVLGGGSSPRVRECVCVCSAPSYCALPPNDALLDTLNISDGRHQMDAGRSRAGLCGGMGSGSSRAAPTGSTDQAIPRRSSEQANVRY